MYRVAKPPRQDCVQQLQRRGLARRSGAGAVTTARSPEEARDMSRQDGESNRPGSDGGRARLGERASEERPAGSEIWTSAFWESARADALHLGCRAVTGRVQVSSSPDVSNHAKGEWATAPRGACKQVRFGLLANSSSCVAPPILARFCAASCRTKVLELVAPVHSRLIADGSRNWRQAGAAPMRARLLLPRPRGTQPPAPKTRLRSFRRGGLAEPVEGPDPVQPAG
jgi:hypothetical protein